MAEPRPTRTWLDPNHWFSPARQLPPAWRISITWLLLILILLFCYSLPLVRFGFLRPPLYFASHRIAVLLSIGVLASVLVVPGRPPGPLQEGGLAFLTIIFLMMAWWVASTMEAGTGLPTIFDNLASDPTVATQLFLSSFAVRRIIQRPPPGKKLGGMINLGDNRLRWVASYLIFLLALIVMIADTDFQFSIKTICWQRWICWRILDAAIIIPYLIAGILVVNGMRMRVVGGVGAIAIPILFFLLWWFGKIV